MKGNNKFLLNEATMIAALQTYFDAIFVKNTLTVKSIQMQNEHFAVAVQELEANPAQASAPQVSVKFT